MPVFKLKIYSRLFIYAALFWMAMGLLHVVSLWLEEPVAYRMEFLSKQRITLFVSAYLCWSFLTVFLYYLIESNPPSKNNIRWIINLAITSLVWLVLITLINQSLSQFLWGQKLKPISSMLVSMPPFLHVFNLVKILLVYSVCAGIFFYRHMQESRIELLRIEREHAQHLEKQLRFQLQALQSQLSPHFLFNCLNTISSLARSQNIPAITTAIANLGSLLRYTLEATNQTRVYLEEEIRFTQHYIALQHIRFTNCFQCDFEISVADTYIVCPPFCLQTLVENVFAHNDLSQSQPIHIAVKIVEQQSSLHIRVENSPLQPSGSETTGLGLNNLRERLHLLYGERSQVQAAATEKGFAASVIFPAGNEHD